MKSKKKAFNRLIEDFDSHEILDAIEKLDELRSLVADRDDYKPPEVRDKLMRLHTMIHKEQMTSKGETIWDLANEIEDDIYNIQDAIEELRSHPLLRSAHFVGGRFRR